MAASAQHSDSVKAIIARQLQALVRRLLAGRPAAPRAPARRGIAGAPAAKLLDLSRRPGRAHPPDVAGAWPGFRLLACDWRPSTPQLPRRVLGWVTGMH